MSDQAQVRLRNLCVLLAGGLAAYWVGRSVAVGGRREDAAIVLAVAAALLPISQWLRNRAGSGLLAIEIPISLLLLSSLTWRVRTAESLQNNPLDAAGRFRVLCVGLAGILSLAALLFGKHQFDTKWIPVPICLYASYIAIVWAGIPLSIHPKLTAYRAVELTTAVVVILGTLATGGQSARARIGRVLFWFTALMVLSIWVEALVMPARGFGYLADNSIPVQWNLQGVYPDVAANGVGFLGVVLGTWSSAGPPQWSGNRSVRGSVRIFLAVLGFVTVLAAQYRTGYICLIAVLLVFAIMRKRVALIALMGVVGICIVLTNAALLQEALHIAGRGQTKAQAEELSGRVDFWRAAIPVWKESPLIGKGLLTATRYEVLGKLGIDRTAGIHSTWVEALVGTGIIGVSLLFGAFLAAARRAWSAARADHGGKLAPLLLLLVIGLRSITGNTFESFQYEALLFLWLALVPNSTAARRGPNRSRSRQATLDAAS